MEVGDLVVEMRFKDTEETEKPILLAAVFEAEGLDLPSRVLASFLTKSWMHFSNYIILT